MGRRGGWAERQGASGQARGRSRRQVRPRRAGPGAGGGARGFIVYGAGPARIFRPFLHSSAAPQPPPLPARGLAGSCAGRGRGAGGRRFKMEMRAGAGRAGADVQRPRAARPGRRPSPGSAAAAAGARPGGQAEAPGWIATARTGASGGGPGTSPEPLPLHCPYTPGVDLQNQTWAISYLFIWSSEEDAAQTMTSLKSKASQVLVTPLKCTGYYTCTWEVQVHARMERARERRGWQLPCDVLLTQLSSSEGLCSFTPKIVWGHFP